MISVLHYNGSQWGAGGEHNTVQELTRAMINLTGVQGDN
jgi:hypothetical protein